MRLLKETLKSSTQQSDQTVLTPGLQKVKHHQWNRIASRSNHPFLLQRCCEDWESAVAVGKTHGQWSQTTIWWFGHQSTKSLLPTKIFLMNDPEHQQHAKGHFDPCVSISVSMSWTWWDTQEGKRLHNHQVILGSKVWGKGWTLLCRKPTSVFCSLAKNVLQLRHTKQSPLQWHKEEIQTPIFPAQTGKRGTGGYGLSYNTPGAAGNHHTGQGQIPHTMINEKNKQLHFVWNLHCFPMLRGSSTPVSHFLLLNCSNSLFPPFVRKIDAFPHMDLLVITQAIIARLAGRWCIHSFEFLSSRATTKKPKTQTWRSNNFSYISKVKGWYIPTEWQIKISLEQQEISDFFMCVFISMSLVAT